MSGLETEMTEPQSDFLVEGKVTSMCYNQTTTGVLATASSGLDGAIVQIWDVSKDPAKCRFSLQDHGGPIIDMAFDMTGSLIATTSRDTFCRIFDPRRGSSPISSFEVKESCRDTRVLWVGESGCLLTVGFAAGSMRQISLW